MHNYKTKTESKGISVPVLSKIIGWHWQHNQNKIAKIVDIVKFTK